MPYCAPTCHTRRNARKSARSLGFQGMGSHDPARGMKRYAMLLRRVPGVQIPSGTPRRSKLSTACSGFFQKSSKRVPRRLLFQPQLLTLACGAFLSAPIRHLQWRGPPGRRIRQLSQKKRKKARRFPLNDTFQIEGIRDILIEYYIIISESNWGGQG